jgi:hypothetical protein
MAMLLLLLLLLLMMMMMITPVFVCLYDQQDPSLCVHLFASLPIFIAPYNYITYVVMFSKKREPFPFFKYLHTHKILKPQQHCDISVYNTGMLHSLILCLF